MPGARVTSAASEGPLLVTVRVYAMAVPGIAVAEPSVLVMERSVSLDAVPIVFGFHNYLMNPISAL